MAYLFWRQWFYFKSNYPWVRYLRIIFYRIETVSCQQKQNYKKMFSRFLKPSLVLCRSVSNTASLRYKDPIYQIFLDKVREYRLKSPKGKPVDPGPEFEAELKEVTERLALQYGGGEGVDMLEFPKFKLPDIDIDPISVDDL